MPPSAYSAGPATNESSWSFASSIAARPGFLVVVVRAIMPAQRRSTDHRKANVHTEIQSGFLPTPAPSRISAEKQACEECRLNKVKCFFAVGQPRCDRCTKHDFECGPGIIKKRGRKAKSKAGRVQEANLTTSSDESRPCKSIRRNAETRPNEKVPLEGLASELPVASSNLPPLLSNAAVRRRAWQIVARIPATRGSTYNFVSSGDADVQAERDYRRSGSKKTKPLLRTTLRRLLQPVLQLSNAWTSDSTSSAVPALPRVISLEGPHNPHSAGIVTYARCCELFAYFMEHLQPWVAVVHFELHHLTLCPLLFTTLCYQASKYEAIKEGKGSFAAAEPKALGDHCRMLCVVAYARNSWSAATLLAFSLLAAWKTADDDFM